MNGLYALHSELGPLHSEPILLQKMNNELYNEMGPLHSDLVQLW
jgi:hypothetical protein